MKKVDNAVVQLNRTLEDAQRESKELEKFVADIDQIKELKKAADKEIRTYYAKKEKLADIEGEVRNLMEVNDHVLDKTDKLLESISKVDAVNSRIDSLSDAYSAVERRINELREYEDIISRNLDAVNKSDLIIQTIDSRIKAFEKVIDRSDKRVEKIGQNLKRVEEETIILRTKESDIRDLRDRLSEIDGLSDHMEERIKQIHAMFQKVETIRKEIDVTDSRLQDMFSQTDRKMKEFSDFIQAVDNNNPILKQVKADVKGTIPGRNLNDNIIKTVRELSGKGWEPESISKKLMLDENSVRFIINTTLL
jgi:chromosome segregation ATPase